MNELERLAVRMGIKLEYRAAAGDVRRTTPDTLRLLLAAMAVPAKSDRDARDALQALERRRWAQALEPQVVRASAAPAAVPVALPAATRGVRWSVLCEDGTTVAGSAHFPDLELEEAHDGRERRRLVTTTLPLGYHRLRLEHDGGDGDDGDDGGAAPLIVVPAQCHLPAPDERLWGLAVQVYALRSSRNLGIGDFGDLSALAPVAAELGADVIGVNPLHALATDDPECASPYSPASRLFLNALYIDVAAVPELAGIPHARQLLAASDVERAAREYRAAPQVRYARVAKLKLGLLEQLFAAFTTHAPDEQRRRFADFRRAHGEPLDRLCRFQALREHFHRRGAKRADWRRWPADYRDAGSAAVARFAEREHARIAFHAWLQWIADQQLASAAAAARDSGVAVGLYRDLAVGADLTGAEAWSYPGQFAAGVTAGAPPDVLNPVGQNWGLPPLSPHGLRSQAYAGFVALLRANMRCAGALRIDHAMALTRLYWIPEGASPADGAYVSYPLEDLVGILALESRRAGCIVIGEDLGTVPEGFRERMQAAGVLSYRVVFFQRDDDRLRAPAQYPHLAVATIGSHDLATLRGWWEERDIAAKERIGLYPSGAEAAKQRSERALERRLLLDALRREGIALPADYNADSPFELALAVAMHEFLARTAAWLAMTQAEDLIEEPEQANLPGTVREYPNWRRKLAVPLEALGADERVRAIAAALRRHRPARRISRSAIDSPVRAAPAAPLSGATAGGGEQERAAAPASRAPRPRDAPR